MKKILSLSITLLSITTSLIAQQFNTSPLTIKEIMKGDDFIGHLPSNVNWSLDGNTIYFDWNPDGAISDSLYSYQLKSGKINKIDFDTAYDLPSPYNTSNKKKTKKVYEKNNDIFLVDLSTNKTFQITNTSDRERNPYFTSNDSKVTYQKDNDIYTWDIATGATTQITNFTDKKDSKDKKSEKDEWLMNDQLATFDVLRERKNKDDDDLTKTY